MRNVPLVLAAICGLSFGPATAAEDAPLSCAELAQRHAERQYAEDSSLLDDRRTGQVHDSALQRDFLRLDAEAYRTRVYRDCLKLRGQPAPAETPPPTRD